MKISAPYASDERSRLTCDGPGPEEPATPAKPSIPFGSMEFLSSVMRKLHPSGEE